ncbi:MAG: flippase-like domain-containing protein [Myxococcales bacterium]|nr:flippase-like domain-containing protein [Myxococcales bacterium]MBL0193653.1 flippase-like domain-containing protein [Myxococcales bacterium]HQY63755.1 lysylphosphatidylglycerol synthase transmembrane domain-containing protein [Polyangiaceae bacterium]
MSEATAAPGERGILRRNAGKLVASAIITVSILVTLQRGGLTLIPRGVSFQNVRWWTLPAYALTFLAMTWFRAVRWRYLLRSFVTITKSRAFAISCIGFAAILLLPFRLGELVRPYMVREPGKVSLSSATGSVVAERVVDGLFLSGLLAVALITVPHLSPLPEQVVGLPIRVAQVRASGFVMLGVFAAAFVTVFVFYFARDFARRATLAVFGLVSKRLALKLSEIAEKLANGLHAFGNARDAGGFLFETTIYWGINACGMWLLAWGCGVVHADGSPITLGESCALMGMLGVTILIPGPPGLLGVFQAGIYAGMSMYFPESVVIGAGAAYVFLLYASQLALSTLVGGFFFFTHKGAVREALDARAHESISPPPEREPAS